MRDARHVAERVARESYGRLVALLAVRTRDIAAAEDALSEALRAALSVWPLRGVPEQPEAWLLTAARRAHGHGERHRRVREAAAERLSLLHAELAAQEPAAVPDERLALLFVCAHPAIDAAVRTPLMLQVVLGLDAAAVAQAFLVSPAAMGQRLVRAKGKIRDAGLRFEVPGTEALAVRLEAVLSAVYAAYGAGWDATPGADDVRGLAGEAIYLGRLLLALLPEEPEVKGLLALMLYCEARAGARRTADGAFVPLGEQDPALWSATLIGEAEALLAAAARAGVFGRFQTEAAIQSVHVTAAASGRANPRALVALYDLLAARTPTIGALVARSAAYGELEGPAAGLALLDALDAERLRSYQPAWAARAHLLRRAGRGDEAAAAYRVAIGLSSDPGVRLYLMGRLAGG